MHGDNMAHNVVYLLYMSKEGEKRETLSWLIILIAIILTYSNYDNKNME